MENSTISFIGFYYAYWAAWITLGLIASVWVYKDAIKLPRLFLGSKPLWWAFATILLGPIWVVLVYWLIHHSTISNRIESQENTDQ
jgi:uncharacterized membrane protein YhdT